MTEPKSLMVNNVKYVREGTQSAKGKDGLKYAIVRTYSAGVFAGYIEKREGIEVTMVDTRRIWYWSGAASLSQLAMEGTKKISECKIAVPVDRILLTQAIEILDVTEEAQEIIEGATEWKA